MQTKRNHSKENQITVALSQCQALAGKTTIASNSRKKNLSMLQGIGSSTSRQAGAPKMPHYGPCPPPALWPVGRNSEPAAKESEVGNLRVAKIKQTKSIII